MYDLIDVEEDFVDFDDDGIDEFGFEDEFGDDEGVDEWWCDVLGIGLNIVVGVVKFYFNFKYVKLWLDNIQYKGWNKVLLKGVVMLVGMVGDIFQVWNLEDSEVYVESVDVMEVMVYDVMVGDLIDVVLVVDEMVWISMGFLVGVGQLWLIMVVFQCEVGCIMVQVCQNLQMWVVVQVVLFVLCCMVVSLVWMVVLGCLISL